LCAVKDCEGERVAKYFCAEHKNLAKRYNTCYSNGQLYKHHMWNRDLIAAINIACLFFATLHGLDLGRWERDSDLKEVDAKSWHAIFEEGGQELPFKIVSKQARSRPVTRSTRSKRTRTQ
jgi:hypothetical protein